MINQSNHFQQQVEQQSAQIKQLQQELEKLRAQLIGQVENNAQKWILGLFK